MIVTETFSFKMAATTENADACRRILAAVAEKNPDGLDEIGVNWTGGWLRSTCTWELRGSLLAVLEIKSIIVECFS